MSGFETIGRAALRIMPFMELSAAVSRHTESPIETILAVAILAQHGGDVELRAHGDGFGPQWTLIPQYPFGRYRADFALRHADGRLFFVECDGRDFHSSPEQVEYDASRDEEMISAGHQVFRFTGAEIHHSAVACVNQLPLYRWRSGR